jgi:hypothetical protein
LKGLEDAPRSGKPKRHVGLRERVLETLKMPPPKGQAAWDGLSLAEVVGAKKSSVYAVLQKDGVQLQRTRSWCVSTDPEFAAKAADIIGLYLRPPERALVLSVDEKPSIQALSRTTGYVRTSSGKIVPELKSTYRRNGVLNLFAALNAATGEVNKKTVKAKTRVDFQAFMDEVVADLPPELGRKALKGASFNTTQELAQAIDEFCDAWHEKAHPFVWRKREVRGSQIKNTISNLTE